MRALSFAKRYSLSTSELTQSVWLQRGIRKASLTSRDMWPAALQELIWGTQQGTLIDNWFIDYVNKDGMFNGPKWNATRMCERKTIKIQLQQNYMY